MSEDSVNRKMAISLSTYYLAPIVPKFCNKTLVYHMIDNMPDSLLFKQNTLQDSQKNKNYCREFVSLFS